MSDILPFADALLRAEAAQTPEEINVVLQEVSDRLGAANSALAVDSARQLLDVIIKKAGR